MLRVTDQAQNKLKEVLVDNNKTDSMIRIYIGGIG